MEGFCILKHKVALSLLNFRELRKYKLKNKYPISTSPLRFELVFMDLD